MRPIIQISKTQQSLYTDAAKTIADRITTAISDHGYCTLVLSGGSTPAGIYKTLAESYKTTIDWNNVHFFWGDERTVPPDHEDSNYRMAYDSLLSKIPVPESNIYRIPAEQPPADAAALYEDTIASFFGTDDLPVFDIILLGLGEDGHTASLFPDTGAAEEKDKLVQSVYVKKLKTHRITLSLPVINNARSVIFLVSGKSKAGVTEEILSGRNKTYPAALVQPTHGELIWLLDQDVTSSAVATLR
jgi:6-phosphogluconolactonase